MTDPKTYLLPAEELSPGPPTPKDNCAIEKYYATKEGKKKLKAAKANRARVMAKVKEMHLGERGK